MSVLITGGAGLVGSECCRLFAEKGWRVISVDNYMRAKILGREADTSLNMKGLLQEYDIEHHEMDIRDEGMLQLIKKIDAVVHAAAQPSHPRSIETPVVDFELNALATLFLLEGLRKHNKNAVFVFCSTNKVYGDAPNSYSYKIMRKRYEPLDPEIWEGFDEGLRVDQSLHTPFGVSKLAADLYTQEYAKLYGLKTGVFRMGCITGGAAMAVEQHNWEPYFVKKAIAGETLTIYGHKGYQVRDVIHARDLAHLFYEFIQKTRPGEVYNVGGGRANSISLLEAIDLIEEITERRTKHVDGPAREGDHIWWITNLRKVKHHYPRWSITHTLKDIFQEIARAI